MHAIPEQTMPASIEFPHHGEVIASPDYTFRIAAPTDASSVEISIDGEGFEPCRASEGRWWFDWKGYAPGCHTAQVRVTLRDGYLFALPPLELRAEPRDSEYRRSERTAPQFSVIVPHEPGALARLIELLSGEPVDLQGMVTERLGESAAVRFVTGRESGLRERLEAAGFPALENEVFHLEIPNRLAELNRLARTLGEEGINILSLYSIANGATARCVLAVDQPERAARTISKNGFELIQTQ